MCDPIRPHHTRLFMQTWLRRKNIDQVTVHEEGRRLVPTLGWPHLVALGIGAIVGTGIYTLIGVGADKAGPAVLLSFIVAGVVCACAALAYAEMSTMMPAAGSAYTYSYTVLGEAIAWVVGWSLILEYSLVVSTVAVGWSGYFVGFLEWVHTQTGWNVMLPTALAAGPHAGGVINLPAIVITFLVAGLLIAGTRESATLNAFLVVFKLIALGVFIAVALPAFDTANLTPFMPYGFPKTVDAEGVERGVMAAAAIIFFAFYGFDAISTAAEETKNPGRDLSIGIVGSMIGCTLIYVLVALAAVGAMSFTVFGKSAEPLALIMRELGHGTAALVIGVVAVIALPTVLLAFFYGQSRIFFVMSRDGLLPRGLSKVNPRTGTPVAITVFTAVLVAARAGVARLDEIAALANAGTLVAFIAVAVCLLVLRKRDPSRPRVFRTPAAWLVGPVAILGCLYLFWSLPHSTQKWFLVWNVIGIVVYVLYSRRASLLGKGQEA
jgi:APA family basic amino acid/polyamine antiporter